MDSGDKERVDKALSLLRGYIHDHARDETKPHHLGILGRAVAALGEPDQPNLGLATTRELLDEIRARIEVDGRLDYRTVGA